MKIYWRIDGIHYVSYEGIDNHWSKKIPQGFDYRTIHMIMMAQPGSNVHVKEYWARDYIFKASFEELESWTLLSKLD